MLYDPTASAEALYVAFHALTATVLSVVVPSIKVTDPVTLPSNSPTLVAVKVTDCPEFDGFGNEVKVVVALAGFIGFTSWRSAVHSPSTEKTSGLVGLVGVGRGWSAGHCCILQLGVTSRRALLLRKETTWSSEPKHLEDLLEKNTMRAEDYTIDNSRGVTVMIGPRGGKIAPSLRHYDEPLDVERVQEFFRNQQLSDASRQDDVRYGFGTGHYGPLVDRNLYCNNEHCPCQNEDLAKRQTRSLRK